MKKETAKVLVGKTIDDFEKTYPNTNFHVLLRNATVYVGGEDDSLLILVSDEWETRLLEVGEYANN